MAGPLITAVIFAFLVGFCFYTRKSPPELSEVGRTKLRNGLLFAAVSFLLLFTICEVIFFGGNWGFVDHRGILFWLIFIEIIVNGVAVFNFLRPLLNLLPFLSGDSSDISPLGMAFAFVLGLIEVLLCFVGFGLVIMD